MPLSEWAQEVARREIGEALVALGLVTGRMRSFGPCPACKAERRSGTDARLPLGINAATGKWKCWSCEAGGDALDAVAALLGRGSTRGLDAAGWDAVRAEAVTRGLAQEHVVAGTRLPSRGSAGSGQVPPPKPSPQPEGSGGPFAWRPDLVAACERTFRENPAAESARAYLRETRKLSDAAIAEHRLGALVIPGGKVPEVWVAIPLCDPRGEPVNVKWRAVPGPCPRCGGIAGCERCSWQDKAGTRHTGKFPGGKVPKYRNCAGRPLPLFGAHRLGDDLSSEVVICEGELDAVALWQYGLTRDVVSGTAGAGTFASKEEWLDALEPYAGFVLAFDGDDKGDEGAQALADKLGVERCSRAKFPHKDAGECLAHGVEVGIVTAAIDNARPMLKHEVVRAGHFAAQIEQLIADPASLRGRPTGLPSLDEYLAGMRPGLMTVSGETKHGKTTLCTWLVREQALMGVPSMVFPLEQSPVGTQMKWLRMELGGDFTKHAAAERAAACARLDALPLWNLNYRGHMKLDLVMQILRYEKRRHGLKVALLDHLGFVQDPDAEDERRDIQRIMRALSHFAEHEELTVLLVVHPSNSHLATGDRVRMGNLRGSSSIRQDSHEVLIVEKAKPTETRRHPATNIHVDAVRSDFGVSGASVCVAYDPLSCCYADRWEDTPSGRRGIMPVIPADVEHVRTRRKKGTKSSRAAGTTDDQTTAQGDA